MQAAIVGTSAVPVVNVIDGIPSVLTTNIAEVFGKEHKHVLRDIENILLSLPQERRCNFNETQVERVNNIGATVRTKAFRLTRDGFYVSRHGLHRRESREIQVGLHRRIQPATSPSREQSPTSDSIRATDVRGRFTC